MHAIMYDIKLSSTDLSSALHALYTCTSPHVPRPALYVLVPGHTRVSYQRLDAMKNQTVSWSAQTNFFLAVYT